MRRIPVPLVDPYLLQITPSFYIGDVIVQRYIYMAPQTRAELHMEQQLNELSNGLKEMMAESENESWTAYE